MVSSQQTSEPYYKAEGGHPSRFQEFNRRWGMREIDKVQYLVYTVSRNPYVGRHIIKAQAWHEERGDTLMIVPSRGGDEGN
jgi:hypothetical protein